MNTNPIGFFDSGIGGISIWKKVTTLLPDENTIYLADSKNAPYGQKLKQQIIDLSCKNTELLLQKGAKIIVVACNTATTNAIGYLRKNYNVPFIGIEPAIKPAALQSKTKKIGILATKGTLNSSLFSEKALQYSDIEILEQIGEGLVPLIENGNINSAELNSLLHNYLDNLLQKNIDYLVLGCSHYPFLWQKIENYIGKKIKIIDSGEAVARQTKTILSKYNLLNLTNKKSTHKLYSNTNVSVLKTFVKESENVVVYRLKF